MTCVGLVFILVFESFYPGSKFNNDSRSDSGNLNFIPHPSFGVVLSKHNEGLDINDDGFLGATFPKEKSDKYFNLLVLGGTKAFSIIRNGKLNTLARKWSSSDGRKIKVYNTAMPGWGEVQAIISYVLLGQKFDGIVYFYPKRQNKIGPNTINSSNSIPNFEKLIYDPSSLSNWRKYLSLNFTKIFNEKKSSNIKWAGNSFEETDKKNRYWEMLIFLASKNNQKLLGYLEKNKFESDDIVNGIRQIGKVEDVFVHLKEQWGFKEGDDK